MHVLGVFAQEHGHGEAWHGIVVPWMRQQAGFAMDVGVTESGLPEWSVNYEGIGYGRFEFEGGQALAAIGKGSGCFICGGNHFQTY